ncbi:3-oxoacyl-[acyl-carrier-protein] synthase-1 [Desulfonauticus submarinus]|uniref:3-oxoacyl-[acyl-carrier-protein] synthase 1 n=1 Tax=Desulfonauticus submarinus TaxID=206665 RepID=A0A1H0FTH0_9BACT|nr:beta-ketoacyl-[acyl-carrier-protein] synthase family protein [Desulfonauticus submarinus]SDN97884.1 3-oxoacyl-[acyl-carrier-protein] synthase-1 [Desulfonauticus submarinus]
MYRVAITGIGIISCLGNTIEDVAKALYKGKSGIEIDPKRIELGFKSPLTGIIKNFDPQKYLSKKQRKTMPLFAIQAYAAVEQALKQAKLDFKSIQNEKTGLIFGSDSTCAAAVQQVDLLRKFKETKMIGSGLVFQSMNSTITMNLNTILKTKGASWTISSACSSGAHAIGQAFNLIALGQQERVICGGAQEIAWEAVCSFDALGAFSTKINNPQGASRPFDANRDGLVPSGGAAALILEQYDLAKQRGAKILGEILSYSFSSDGNHLTIPQAEGLKRTMESCLKQANITPKDVNYICAHATSTQAGDAVEAQAIKQVFENYSPYVSSTKSMTGHELWMSGASQIVYSTIMANYEFIAPNINFQTPDKYSQELNIAKETIETKPNFVLCNAAGFGGTNASILLRYF